MTRWRKARRDDREASITPEERARLDRIGENALRNHRLILEMAELHRLDRAGLLTAPAKVDVPDRPIADPPPEVVSPEPDRPRIGFRPPV
jgi:hypothetical protein